MCWGTDFAEIVSGKTTLVNRILTSHLHGKRIVVIENEAGALSIDDKILRASEQEKEAAGIFVMKNGCLCCTGDGAGAELERVLNHLLALLDQHVSMLQIIISDVSML
jgi:G3E family GTPase